MAIQRRSPSSVTRRARFRSGCINCTATRRSCSEEVSLQSPSLYIVETDRLRRKPQLSCSPALRRRSSFPPVTSSPCLTIFHLQFPRSLATRRRRSNAPPPPRSRPLPLPRPARPRPSSKPRPPRLSPFAPPPRALRSDPHPNRPLPHERLVPLLRRPRRRVGLRGRSGRVERRDEACDGYEEGTGGVVGCETE